MTRHLRNLIPLGRPARSAPANARSSGLDRRRVLGLLAAAPVAAPPLARAALAPEPFSEWVTTFETIGADAPAGGVELSSQIAGLSARLIPYEELQTEQGRIWAAVEASVAAEADQRRALGLQCGMPDAGLSAAARPMPACCPFIDNAGSGP